MVLYFYCLAVNLLGDTIVEQVVENLIDIMTYNSRTV
jgi:hypothetical protein